MRGRPAASWWVPALPGLRRTQPRVPQRPRGQGRKEGPGVSVAPFQKLVPQSTTDAAIVRAENRSYAGSTPTLHWRSVKARDGEMSDRFTGDSVNFPKCKSRHCPPPTESSQSSRHPRWLDPPLTPQSPPGGRCGPTTLQSGHRLMPPLSPRELLRSCGVLGRGRTRHRGPVITQQPGVWPTCHRAPSASRSGGSGPAPGAP